MKFSTIKQCSAFLFALLLTVGFIGESFAQGSKSSPRKYGIAASLQGGQTQIIIPIWIGNKMVVAPNIALAMVSSVSTTISPGVTFRFYMKKIQRITPYVGFGGGASIFSPSGGGASSTTLLINGLWGAEFFMHSKFSFGVEAGIGVTKPKGSGTKISTGTGVLVNIYL